jgi:protein-arginine deiminase
LSEENRRIEEVLVGIKHQVCEGLGIGDGSFIEAPALFRDGIAVIPNMVNSLVVGKQVFAPDPLGPVIGHVDVFAEAFEAPLTAVGLEVHFVDVWDYYHSNAGEIHCGTNAVRRITNPEWWRTK